MIGPTIAAVLVLVLVLLMLVVFFIGYEAGKEVQEKRHRKNSYR